MWTVYMFGVWGSEWHGLLLFKFWLEQYLSSHSIQPNGIDINVLIYTSVLMDGLTLMASQSITISLLFHYIFKFYSFLWRKTIDVVAELLEMACSSFCVCLGTVLCWLLFPPSAPSIVISYILLCHLIFQLFLCCVREGYPFCGRHQFSSTASKWIEVFILR